jgi:two-component sensor histidine kinase
VQYFLDKDASEPFNELLDYGPVKWRQMDSAKSTGCENTAGLGRSIVKKFFDTLDGDLKLNSEKRNGVCFTIEFEKT